MIIYQVVFPLVVHGWTMRLTASKGQTGLHFKHPEHI